MADFYFTDYEAVDASQTAQVIGPAGGTGDILAKLIITVSISLTGTVSIKDGANDAIVITAANTPIGVYEVELNARSVAGAWQITTGAGASVVAVGKFK